MRYHTSLQSTSKCFIWEGCFIICSFIENGECLKLSWILDISTHPGYLRVQLSDQETKYSFRDLWIALSLWNSQKIKLNYLKRNPFLKYTLSIDLLVNQSINIYISDVLCFSSKAICFFSCYSIFTVLQFDDLITFFHSRFQ